MASGPAGVFPLPLGPGHVATPADGHARTDSDGQASTREGCGHFTSNVVTPAGGQGAQGRTVATARKNPPQCGKGVSSREVLRALGSTPVVTRITGVGVALVPRPTAVAAAPAAIRLPIWHMTCISQINR